MRQGPHQKRGRGRGNRRSNTPNRNQTFDSNGPDVRIRGNATQVYEKYLNLARDATTSGDRVLAESYFQHADHYYRILSAFQESQNEDQRNRGNGAQPSQGNDWNSDDDDRDESGGGESRQSDRQADQADDRNERRGGRDRDDRRSKGGGDQPAVQANGDSGSDGAQAKPETPAPSAEPAPAAAAAPAEEKPTGEKPAKEKPAGEKAASAPATEEEGDDGIRRTLRLSSGRDESDEPAPRRPRRRRAAPKTEEVATGTGEDAAPAAERPDVSDDGAAAAS